MNSPTPHINLVVKIELKDLIIALQFSKVQIIASLLLKRNLYTQLFVEASHTAGFQSSNFIIGLKGMQMHREGPRWPLSYHTRNVRSKTCAQPTTHQQRHHLHLRSQFVTKIYIYIAVHVINNHLHCLQ